MLFSTFAAVLASVVAVSAQTQHLIIVGGNSTKTFNPTSINASVGDTVAFQFQSGNHTVTQSTFAAPCANMTTPTEGIDSGFQFVAPGATTFAQWSFNVTNATTPLWFYCRQTGHCQAAGMVFAVNPTAAKTFTAFQAAAMASGSSASPSGSASGSSGAASPSASSTAANGAVRYSGSAAVALAVIGLSVAVLL